MLGHHTTLWLWIFRKPLFEIGSHAVQAGLELALHLKMALTSSFVCLLSARITGMYDQPTPGSEDLLDAVLRLIL